MLKKIAIPQIIDCIRFENTSWASGEIDQYFQKMPNRSYFQHFYANTANE